MIKKTITYQYNYETIILIVKMLMMLIIHLFNFIYLIIRNIIDLLLIWVKYTNILVSVQNLYIFCM